MKKSLLAFKMEGGDDKKGCQQAILKNKCVCVCRQCDEQRNKPLNNHLEIRRYCKLAKRFFVILAAMSLVFALVGSASAQKGNGTPSGVQKIFQFNIIGKKNGDIGGDTSNGKSIMIPLKTTTTPSKLEYCAAAQESAGVKFVDDVWPNYSSDVPQNARLNFVVCDEANPCTDFVISDRDAIDDKNATILVPRELLDATTKGILFDVYIRVMGKPLQCMEIEGYAYDTTDTGTIYYNTGSVYLSKKGKTAFVQINELFDVLYCDPGALQCTNDISVFADVFEGYFWEMYNNGTKVVQVRIYARPL